MSLRFVLFAVIVLCLSCVDVHARTVWRCLRDGTVSLATAAEPGSNCTQKALDDNAAAVPNLWGAMGVFHGTLYQREQDGRIVYSTRNLPGSTPLLHYTVATPPASPAHAGLGAIGKPQIGVYQREFRSAARTTGVDEAWLRAIAHAESAYAADAVSTKGAKGVMQLMPDVIGDYGVKDPFSPAQSILAGARYLKALTARYEGDDVLAAAAYNAGVAAVEQYGGVPPYAETQEYVGRVSELYTRYRTAMGLAPRAAHLQPAR
ncbi:MAG TPA: lytic transglycosylase domain-containing protein [Rudaea sp.]|nr:lytic transglycosylase domain-containing protein [Rudaea sp.]